MSTLPNPTVDVSAPDLGSSQPAGAVECSIAPWDAAINNNRDGPGGEHSEAVHAEVARECHAANMLRFRAHVGTGVAAILLFGVGVVGWARSSRQRTSRGVVRSR